MLRRHGAIIRQWHSLSCAGNLNLDGGWLKGDSQISLFANGDITLNNLNLYAPEISLSNLTGTMTIGSNVFFDITHTATVHSGTINIDRWLPNRVIELQDFDIGLNPGAVISVGTGSASIINRIIDNRSTLGGSLSLTSAQSLMLTNASQITPINSANTMCLLCLNNGYMMMLAGLGLMAYRRKAKKPSNKYKTSH